MAATSVEFVRFLRNDNTGMGQGVLIRELLGEIYLFEDPESCGPHDLRYNRIRGTARSFLDIEETITIPIIPYVSRGDVVSILDSLPKIDTSINPGGLFVWDFGDYVKRFLRVLRKEGILSIDMAQYRGADHWFDLNIAVIL
jgi:hypothetical protein